MGADIEESSEGIIQAIARLKHVDLRQASADCLLYVYALALIDMERILDKTAESIETPSIQRIRDAFQEIHSNLRDLKRKGKLKGKKLTDAKTINPSIEKCIGLLISILAASKITDQGTPNSPERLVLYLAALSKRGEELTACGGLVSDIIDKVGWWSEDEKVQECSKEQSESPPPIPFIDQGSKRRQWPA